MARRDIDKRIAELEEQAKALKARKAATERANDTRRTVVLGSLILQEIDKDTEASKALRSWLAKELPEKLTRDRDREIFAELLTKISHNHDA
ncbi:mobilization protein [Agrobacterium sp. OT33]|uniref:mobilization protein n=1 Tax=Agrobacterium sp. OT33 TaxID=2815338 RepID=UPI001A8DB23A|nr:mobilization protein [Agrobacterium sp. OT33]MBO0129097.1 mobilization protein [Agrobacterium sp. OT33]